MRSILIPTLGVILGGSGVFAGVIRDIPNPNVTCNEKSVQSVDSLPQVTQCIETFCASKDGSTELHCDTAVLTISAPVSDKKECVNQFRSVINQCTSGGSIHGGISQTEKVLYEIFAVEEGHQHDKRAKAKTPAKKTPAKNTPAKSTPKASPKVSPQPTPQPTPKVSSKASSKIGGKTTSLNTRSQSTKTQSSSGRTSSAACEQPTYTLKAGKIVPKSGQDTKNGQTTKPKSGKAARDVVSNDHDHDHKLLPRTKSPATPGGSAPVCKDIKRWYQAVDLEAGKAQWWTYSKTTGWRDVKDQSTGAYTVLKDMTDKGKLDVIRIKNGAMSVVGNKEGGSDPKKFAKQGGKYLLTNGGFFAMPDQFPDTPYWSVGTTSSTDKNLPIDARYQPYFSEIKGDDGTFVHSGPELSNQIPLSNKEFKWSAENVNGIPGSLAHCINPNERLAVAITGRDKYIFAYTAATRDDGADINKFRDIINTWYRTYARRTIDQATSQIVNLDGGGSIYVSWNDGSTEFVIAAGGRRGVTRGLAGVSTPRPVVNLLKID